MGLGPMNYDETLPPTSPNLEDVLGMVEALNSKADSLWRYNLALALSHTDLNALSGLVVRGHAHEVRIFQEFAVCRCGDERHEYRRDLPPGRGHWHSDRDVAEADLRHAVEHQVIWDPKYRNPVPHLVSHYIASTQTRPVS
jgi:hypothetical protein